MRVLKFPPVQWPDSLILQEYFKNTVRCIPTFLPIDIKLMSFHHKCPCLKIKSTLVTHTHTHTHTYTHTHTHGINRFSRLLYPSSGPFGNETKGYGVRENNSYCIGFPTSTHGSAKSKFLTKYLYQAEMRCLLKKLPDMLILARQSVRGITCKSYNLYHLKKLKLCLLNNEFKVRLSKVTYLGYI